MTVSLSWSSNASINASIVVGCSNVVLRKIYSLRHLTSHGPLGWHEKLRRRIKMVVELWGPHEHALILQSGHLVHAWVRCTQIGLHCGGVNHIVGELGCLSR